MKTFCIFGIVIWKMDTRTLRSMMCVISMTKNFRRIFFALQFKMEWPYGYPKFFII